MRATSALEDFDGEHEILLVRPFVPTPTWHKKVYSSGLHAGKSGSRLSSLGSPREAHGRRENISLSLPVQ